MAASEDTPRRRLSAVEASRAIARETWCGERPSEEFHVFGLNSERVVRERLARVGAELEASPSLAEDTCFKLQAIGWETEDPQAILDKTERLLAFHAPGVFAQPADLLHCGNRDTVLLARLLIIQCLAGRLGRWAVRETEIADARTARALYRDVGDPRWSRYDEIVQSCAADYHAGRYREVVLGLLEADRLARTPAGLLRAAMALTRAGNYTAALWVIRTCLLERPATFDPPESITFTRTLEELLRYISVDGPGSSADVARLQPVLLRLEEIIRDPAPRGPREPLAGRSATLEVTPGRSRTRPPPLPRPPPAPPPLPSGGATSTSSPSRATPLRPRVDDLQPPPLPKIRVELPPFPARGPGAAQPGSPAALPPHATPPPLPGSRARTLSGSRGSPSPPESPSPPGASGAPLHAPAAHAAPPASGAPLRAPAAHAPAPPSASSAPPGAPVAPPPVLSAPLRAPPGHATGPSSKAPAPLASGSSAAPPALGPQVAPEPVPSAAARSRLEGPPAASSSHSPGVVGTTLSASSLLQPGLPFPALPPPAPPPFRPHVDDLIAPATVLILTPASAPGSAPLVMKIVGEAPLPGEFGRRGPARRSASSRQARSASRSDPHLASGTGARTPRADTPPPPSGRSVALPPGAGPSTPPAPSMLADPRAAPPAGAPRALAPAIPLATPSAASVLPAFDPERTALPQAVLEFGPEPEGVRRELRTEPASNRVIGGEALPPADRASPARATGEGRVRPSGSGPTLPRSPALASTPKARAGSSSSLRVDPRDQTLLRAAAMEASAAQVPDPHDRTLSPGSAELQERPRPRAGAMEASAAPEPRELRELREFRELREVREFRDQTLPPGAVAAPESRDQTLPPGAVAAPESRDQTLPPGVVLVPESRDPTLTPAAATEPGVAPAFESRDHSFALATQPGTLAWATARGPASEPGLVDAPLDAPDRSTPGLPPPGSGPPRATKADVASRLAASEDDSPAAVHGQPGALAPRFDALAPPAPERRPPRAAAGPWTSAAAATQGLPALAESAAYPQGALGSDDPAQCAPAHPQGALAPDEPAPREGAAPAHPQGALAPDEPAPREGAAPAPLPDASPGPAPDRAYGALTEEDPTPRAGNERGAPADAPSSATAPRGASPRGRALGRRAPRSRDESVRTRIGPPAEPKVALPERIAAAPPRTSEALPASERAPLPRLASALGGREAPGPSAVARSGPHRGAPEPAGTSAPRQSREAAGTSAPRQSREAAGTSAPRQSREAAGTSAPRQSREAAPHGNAPAALPRVRELLDLVSDVLEQELEGVDGTSSVASERAPTDLSSVGVPTDGHALASASPIPSRSLSELNTDLSGTLPFALEDTAPSPAVRGPASRTGGSAHEVGPVRDGGAGAREDSGRAATQIQAAHSNGTVVGPPPVARGEGAQERRAPARPTARPTARTPVDPPVGFTSAELVPLGGGLSDDGEEETNRVRAAKVVTERVRDRPNARRRA